MLEWHKEYIHSYLFEWTILVLNSSSGLSLLSMLWMKKIFETKCGYLFEHSNKMWCYLNLYLMFTFIYFCDIFFHLVLNLPKSFYVTTYFNLVLMQNFWCWCRIFIEAKSYSQNYKNLCILLTDLFYNITRTKFFFWMHLALSFYTLLLLLRIGFSYVVCAFAEFYGCGVYMVTLECVFFLIKMYLNVRYVFILCIKMNTWWNKLDCPVSCQVSWMYMY